jgi:hypothetical protein
MKSLPSASAGKLASAWAIGEEDVRGSCISSSREHERGIHGNELVVRIDPETMESALAEPGTRIFDMTGRPMKGWLLVGAGALKGDTALAKWVRRGLDYQRLYQRSKVASPWHQARVSHLPTSPQAALVEPASNAKARTNHLEHSS